MRIIIVFVFILLSISAKSQSAGVITYDYNVATIPFNEGNGTTVTADGYTATLNGVTWSVNMGGSLSFDGISQHYVNIPGLMDDVPNVGTIALSFMLTTAPVSGNPRLFYKKIGSNLIDCYIEGATGRIIIAGAQDIVAYTGITYTANTEYRLLITWTTAYLYAYLNGAQIFYLPTSQIFKTPTGVANNFIIGAYDDSGASGYVNVFLGNINRFKLTDSYTTGAGALADYNGFPSNPTKQQDKWFPIEGNTVFAPPVSTSDGEINAEPSVLKRGTNDYVMFFTVAPTEGIQVHVATAANPQGPWTRQGKVADGTQSYAFKHGGNYYLFVGTTMTLYRSPNGVNTWTNLGVQLTLSDFSGVDPISSFGNTGVLVDVDGNAVVGASGQFEFFVEGMVISTSIWEVFLAKSATVEGVKTVTNKLSSLRVPGSGMYGGTDTKYIGGVYHMWYHYGGDPLFQAGNLPTRGVYSTSTNGTSWTIREAPLMEITAAPFGKITDQLADPYLLIDGDRVYYYADFVCNVPDNKDELRYWTYPGTFTQLVYYP